MERNALIITGQIRTFEKTWENILHNVIIPNNFDVFMYIDNRGKNTPWLPMKNEFIKEIKFMSQEDALEYEQELNQILQKPEICNKFFTYYLTHSGSILEYFQYSKGVSIMENYENIHDIQYKYIMRGRCDIAFTEPFKIIDFFKIVPTLQVVGEKNKDIEDQSYASNFLESKFFEVKPYVDLINIGPIFNLVYKYGRICHTENIIFTIRGNVIWCGERKNMMKLTNIFFNYGDFKDSNNSCYWNSESQFDLFLQHNNMTHVDYYSTNDEKFFIDMNYNKKFLNDPEKGLFTIIR